VPFSWLFGGLLKLGAFQLAVLLQPIVYFRNLLRASRAGQDLRQQRIRIKRDGR